MRLPGILPHCAAFRPRASMENSAAGAASILNPKSNASAAASKAGPRFAEVAGRNIRNCMPDGPRESAISLVLRFEGAQDCVGTGVQHHGGLPLFRRQCPKVLVRHTRNRQIAAMKLDGVLRVLEHVPG